MSTRNEEAEFWETQTHLCVQEIEELSSGINELYELMGFKKIRTSAINPAYEQLRMITEKIKAGL